ncbi:MAG: hypothetical protein LIQ30_12370, partial [Planctomycetes bacterium]|nr:hypothetical protein [Planctomycetota bacterium]
MKRIADEKGQASDDETGGNRVHAAGRKFEHGHQDKGGQPGADGREGAGPVGLFPEQAEKNRSEKHRLDAAAGEQVYPGEKGR